MIISKNLTRSKKGYVFSVTALIIAVLLFAFLNSRFYDPNYSLNQEQIDNRINQLDREFLYVKDSVLPQVVRFSHYYATQEFLNITANNESIRNSLNYSHINIQNSIMVLAINGTFNNTPNSAMQNRTVEYLMSSYEDFFEDFLISNFTYEIKNGRVYEKTPLFVSVQMEVDVRLEAKELDVEIFDTKIVDVSFSVENFIDPNIAFNINTSSAEKLLLERNSPTYGGDWTWDLFNDTFDKGYVTTFVFPEYKYTLGTSFLRAFTNSTQRGLYRDILSFLSFQHNQNSTPYDTKNFNITHNLYAHTLFLASFNNVSSRVDETSYNYPFIINSPNNCTISGVSGRGCNITTPIGISGLRVDGNESMISFWINYTNPGVIFNSSTLSLEVDPTTQSLNIMGKRNGTSDFIITNVSLNPNRWNNILIHATPFNNLEFLVNSEIRYNQFIEGSFQTFKNISFSNAQFDEIVVLNRSVSSSEISKINRERNALFLDYIDSLHTSGLNLFGGEEVILNLSNRLNTSYNEFGIEFWFRAQSINSPFRILNLENSTDFFEIYLNSTNIEINSTLFNRITPSFELDNNEYRHVLIQLTNANELQVYVNTQLILNETFTGSIGDYANATLLDRNSQMVGVFDEFVLYNTSFSQKEIEEHYFNFESVVGGCCNYFKLYNEANHGISLPDNNSIASPIVNSWDIYNITLVRADQKNSSFPTSAPWYGQYVDACIIYVYNLDNYADTSTSANVKPGDIGFTCPDLIENGVY